MATSRAALRLLDGIDIVDAALDVRYTNLSQSRGSLEELLREQIQVVAPLGGVVTVGIDMPDVRHVVLFEIGVHALADAD